MKWKVLTIEDRNIIQKFLKGRFETSDMNFTNIFLWSKSENVKYKIEDEILYFTGEYENDKYYLCPVLQDESTENLIKAIEKLNLKNSEKIVFIPGEEGERLKLNFKLLEKRDSYDYIYLQKDLSELVGRKFSSKKNKINKFIKMYNYTYEKISKDNIEELREFQKEWTKNRIEDKIIVSENMGINAIFDNYETLELRGGLIRVDKEIVSYAFGEKLTDKMGVIHIEKGLAEYQGCYQMINKLVAKEEFSDVIYINREDDFGSSGLREAKLSYQPIKLLTKYNIES
ncbi:phosphatidylglycerol lysyltransferase domain-containing protein [uncultured Cetobacterium sp.]|uniref:DUF2156 domain-containing protein n=1 Tax=uncultured Cetobacterium sp. TaxID=527638 RepID=UPI002618B153|nr:phosphatidylglycerol lysyltransferase domain-containing protein [uncultured Cetobacterium sp.]